MKKNLLTQFLSIAIFLFYTHSVSAQNWVKLLPKQNTINHKQLTLHTIEKAFNDYWGPKHVKNGYYMKDGKKVVAPGWKLFKEWQWYWQQRVNPITGTFPNTNALTEFNKSVRQLKKSTKTLSSANWSSLGPDTSPGNGGGLGRINCVTFNPSDANTYWVGTPSGGIWETTDDGASWSILNNNQPVLGVSDIAVPSDYSTTNTLFIATGDRDGGSSWSLGTGHNDDNESIGVLKSTDGGSTWNKTGLTFTVDQNRLINRLLIDPNNDNILYAATNVGIFVTKDGGNSWGNNSPNFDNNVPFFPDTNVIDMELKPGDSQTIYASTKDYYNNPVIIRSTDGGANWTVQKTFSSSDYRIQIAVSAANAQNVYAVVCDNNSALSGIYKSTDSGSNFSLIFDGTQSNHNLLGYNYDASDSGKGQGGYDLCIAVSPTNTDTIFIGGVNTWESTDGGSTWILNNYWSSYSGYNPNNVQVIHADQHVLRYQNGTNNLFEGNDGGIYKSANEGTSWTEKTNGLIISQIYSISVSQTSSSIDVAGLQDNGSKVYLNGIWYEGSGGDGTTCLVDYSDPNYLYMSYVQGEIYGITDALSSPGYTTISQNIPGGQPKGAWVTPFILNPQNPKTLYAGYSQVYKTTDRGNTWTDISSGGFSSGNNLHTLACAPSDTNYLYAADFTRIWKTTDGGASPWTEITGSLPVSDEPITNIAVSNSDPNTLWVTFGGYSAGEKVYQSTDAGNSWANISGVLPNFPVLCIIQNKRITANPQLFIGTDMGVYAKDGSNDWIAFNDGLPNVVITDLDIYYDATNSANDRLRAGSFGRGMWETPIVQPMPVELTAFNAAAIKDNIRLSWETATETNNSGFGIERKILNQDGNESNTWEQIDFVKGAGNSTSPMKYSYTDDNLSNATSFQYRLKMIDFDGNYKYSKELSVTSKPTDYALLQNHPNPFNPSTVIEYKLPEKSKVVLSVYDIIGNKVATLVNGVKEAGIHSVQFDAANLASGVYFYRLTTNNNSFIKKMLLLK